MPTEPDWQTFTAWAEDEGWTVPEFEIGLYRTVLRDSAFALRKDERCVGFVTVAGYEKSGWIGNLIVPPEQRKQGLGRRLFEKALQHLESRKLSSLWLTASEAGRPLYEQYGFRDIGAVERLVRPPAPVPEHATPPEEKETILRLDRAVWGEARAKLMPALAESSLCFATGKAATLLQQHRDLQVIGPCYAPYGTVDELEAILERCLASARPDRPVLIDLLASHPAKSILVRSGFRPTGFSRLMTKGCHDHVDRGSLVSFASLGSMG